MRNLLLILIGFSALILCCNSNKVDQVGTSPFAGNWISQNYLDSLISNGIPSRVHGVGCDELIINFSGDSAYLNSGLVEGTVFKISDKKENSFIIKKFNREEATEFTLTNKGRELRYTDMQTGVKYVFTKMKPKYAVKMINGWSSGLELFMNEKIIAANYYLINVENKRGNLVAFTSYGDVKGLPGYTNFSLCLAGDCRSMSTEDLITLKDASHSDDFIWQWRNDTLVFCSVVNTASEDEKPEFSKGEDIYRFVKKF